MGQTLWPLQPGEGVRAVRGAAGAAGQVRLGALRLQRVQHPRQRWGLITCFTIVHVFEPHLSCFTIFTTTEVTMLIAA